MFVKVLSFTVFMSAALQVAAATSLQVQTIKTAIKNSKATWEAKDNHLSQYSKEELRRMMGYHRQPQDDVSFTPVKLHFKTTTETLVDWRNHGGQNWVSPVLDQGNCGSCVAFATVGTLETQANITRQLPWLNPKYSPQALFACGGGSCDMGWYPSAAANFLKTTGVPDESCAPYTSGATGQDISCSSVCANSDARVQKISDYKSLSSPDDVKEALTHGPLITTMTVYEDFPSYSSGVYKHVTGGQLGGHAISLVGFDDIGRYWIIRNSWSGDWGEKGFARISYDDDSGVGGEAWSLNVPTTDGSIALSNLNDRDYRKGAFKISATSNYSSTTSLVLDLTSPSGKVQSQSCLGKVCDFAIDSSAMEDGLYHETIHAKSDMNTVADSEEKYFYIMNKVPSKVSLSFAGKDVDLTQNLKGRVEFNVDAKTSSVPFTALEFIVTQNGQVIKDHFSRNIADTTVLGWRTTTVPNGVYQIQLLGKFIVGDKEEYTHNGGTFTVTVNN
jgi:C1A family cysteine protease